MQSHIFGCHKFIYLWMSYIYIYIFGCRRILRIWLRYGGWVPISQNTEYRVRCTLFQFIRRYGANCTVYLWIQSKSKYAKKCFVSELFFYKFVFCFGLNISRFQFTVFISYFYYRDQKMKFIFKLWLKMLFIFFSSFNEFSGLGLLFLG